MSIVYLLLAPGCATQAEINDLKQQISDQQGQIDELRGQIPDPTAYLSPDEYDAAAASEEASDAAELQALQDQIATLEGRLPDPLGVGGVAVTEMPTQTFSPASCDELQALLTELDQYRIARDAVVTIQLPVGNVYCEAEITFTHPDGARIRLQGYGSQATALIFDGGSNGILVGPHAALGYLGDLEVQGGDTVGSAGLTVTRNSTLVQMGSTTLSHWATGMSVEYSSALASSATSELNAVWVVGSPQSGDEVDVLYGSVALLNYLHAQDGVGTCLYAAHNSFVSAIGAQLGPCGGTAAYAHANSTVVLDSDDGGVNASVTQYQSWGIEADLSSAVSAVGVQGDTSLSAAGGVLADLGSTVMAQDATFPQDSEAACFWSQGESYIHAIRATAGTCYDGSSWYAYYFGSIDRYGSSSSGGDESSGVAGDTPWFIFPASSDRPVPW